MATREGRPLVEAVPGSPRRVTELSMNIDLDEVRREATAQLAKERFDELVAKEVARLKTHRPWWRRLFPWVITIRRVK